MIFQNYQQINRKGTQLEIWRYFLHQNKVLVSTNKFNNRNKNCLKPKSRTEAENKKRRIR